MKADLQIGEFPQ